MHRCVGIPARHKRVILEKESELWKFASGRDSFLAEIVSRLPSQRDHIVLEVFVEEKWSLRDVTRDRDLEEGMGIYGIPLEREGDFTRIETIEDFDQWVSQRQRQVSLSENRDRVLSRINRFVELIREAGRLKRRL